MKILVVSEYGEVIDVCRRMIEEGNDVYIYVKDTDVRTDRYGDGYGVRYLDILSGYEGYDIIIFDGAIFGDIPLKLRKTGKKVVGGCKLTDELENNRVYFYRVCNLLGIKTPKVVEFDTKEEVVRYIKKYPNEYVLKSCSAEKSVTLVAKEKNSVDLINFVLNLDNVKKFYLQHKVKGYEVAISCFFNGERFIPPAIVNYEYKKLGTENVGVFTGEMGTVLKYYPYIEMRFFNETLKKLEPYLKGKYVGIIDLNTITNTSGVYCLEATCRFGYPITDIMSSNVKQWSKLFLDLVNGNFIENNFKSLTTFSIGVVLSALAPFSDKNPLIGLPFINFEKYKDVVSIYGVSNGKIVDPYVCIVSVSDKNLKLAQNKVYDFVDKINTPSLFFFRTDIGDTSYIAHKWLEGQKFFVLSR